MGNLPIDSLKYYYQWEDTPEYTKFTETYSKDDVIVKQSCHVYSRVLFPVTTNQGNL